tara:strand:+ start:7247 stop:7735 length:489 start_codon:yes stop_codon:yes gene_type:complete
MNIHKKFLPPLIFKNIQSNIMSEKMPWYFINGINGINDDYFKFTFTFLDDLKINNEMIKLINPLLLKINTKNFYSIKVNLLTKTNKIIEHGYHTDFNSDSKKFKGKTALYYINTCNGYTKFKNGKKIKSEENKFVEFDTKIEHTSSSCTDEKNRIVINFNYE